ncbi:tetratricopeptide repeat protein [Pedosphaera parvula]|uniref:Uncharacterized protein n=1 Tax=Pedosphaera parvula (strain Ellin514) TaxID=320771 RepID=B9XHY7_PEDPL|nr:hypothetical protein [Pedosphaera parvula]EEF60480.1 hypothetical protein Cflav_PD3450 [Pedosphaera parvula Ellin514]
MKTWFKKISLFSLLLGMGGWLLATAWAAPPPPALTGDAGAIQAIQQAPDPSAAIAAYANGSAIDRNDPRLFEAYVARMVDFGLPEMAYHQAQTLTTLESNNGLAYGVIAYIDARRGQMQDAISAINVAVPLAPGNKFIQSTAGEILAWYDIKADQVNIPDNAKAGLAKVRQLLSGQAAFAQAFDTAKKAYQTQASDLLANPSTATNQPSEQPLPNMVVTNGYPVGSVSPQTAPEAYAAPTDYGAPAYAPPYYSSYYYDWGPGWVQPAPWWWWQPIGFFGGFSFFPFGATFLFDNDDFFFHNHHFHHNDHFFHDHNGQFFHGHNQNFAHGNFDNRFAFHHGVNGKTTFFGKSAATDPVVARSAHMNFQHTAGTAPFTPAFTTRGLSSRTASTFGTHVNNLSASGFTAHQRTLTTAPGQWTGRSSAGMGASRWTSISPNSRTTFGAPRSSAMVPGTGMRVNNLPASGFTSHQRTITTMPNAAAVPPSMGRSFSSSHAFSSPGGAHFNAPPSSMGSPGMMHGSGGGFHGGGGSAMPSGGGHMGGGGGGGHSGGGGGSSMGGGGGHR